MFVKGPVVGRRLPISSTENVEMFNAFRLKSFADILKNSLNRVNLLFWLTLNPNYSLVDRNRYSIKNNKRPVFVQLTEIAYCTSELYRWKIRSYFKIFALRNSLSKVHLKLKQRHLLGDSKPKRMDGFAIFLQNRFQVETSVNFVNATLFHSKIRKVYDFMKVLL